MKITLIAFICAFILLGCAKIVEKKLSTTSISPIQFQELLNSGEYTLLDVRTHEEVAEKNGGKITSTALHLDFFSADFSDQISQLDRDKKYLVYCRSGNRSGKTIALMNSQGFSETFDLAGGKTAWDKFIQKK